MLSYNSISTPTTPSPNPSNGIRVGASTSAVINNSLQSTPSVPKEVAEIRLNLANDWKVLRSVHQMLVDEKAFCANPDEWHEKIVNFVQPEELKKLIDLKIEENQKYSLEEIQKICQQVIKYSVKTSHGRFHNQLFGQMDPYGLAGSWITEALNTSAYTFEVAPVFSLVETEVVRKVCELCGYGQGDGIFSPGGSISNMYGVVLARYRSFPNIKSSGMFGMPPLVLFTSEESHYSFKKAAHWLGFGVDNCVIVKTNAKGQMLPEDLEIKIIEAQGQGKIPLFVNATAGTTVLGAFDDFNRIADVCQRYGLWMHVDACLGGSALLSYKYRNLLKGLERSDSFSWNPHKSLGTPLQCALFLTRHAELLPQANSTAVHYLFQQDKFYDISYDTGNKSIQCGRKIDAFKFWIMLKARGYGSFGRLVDHALDMSKVFMDKLRQRPGFRLVLDDYQYGNVCFWYVPKAMREQTEDDKWRQKLYEVAPKVKELMIRQGTLMLGYSPLQYRNIGNFFRMVFTCFPIMDESELDFILNEIERLGDCTSLSNGCL
ncbi:cysteine sulfinic acid decarboxylase [Stomoxys calcitrans]|uniref:Cysteine sulfinic acid decarboxylase n=1 Tax=Stomoxys calcitrans TaxID=35570 RepID=A0A1I8Q5Q3_STOCA|nr:cysteine sulfinic acid decarboxylase [Stomoxys calcitrans]